MIELPIGIHQTLLAICTFPLAAHGEEIIPSLLIGFHQVTIARTSYRLSIGLWGQGAISNHMRETSVSVTGDTWKVLHELYRETGISKRRLVELAVRHLAGCKDAKTALSLLGYDAEAISKVVEENLNEGIVLLSP